ncbi:hypothetical protein LWI29_024624 [Acer saccharum]|uniref:Zinc knuckle CX2CX4HX4C domain-containing protein n=1 Tax=Acer saccharum TaxID=4024 RepID=A0AA39VE70_ACESA|nr:hypothetical protein LWI29_024624 [Acer saccharum]
MCMEAALSLSSPVAVSSTLNSQVGLSTVSGVNFSSRVVPLASGGMCSLVGRPIPPQPEGGVSVIVPDSVTGLIQSSASMVQGGKSFVGLFKSCPVKTLPVSSVLSKKGGMRIFLWLPKFKRIMFPVLRFFRKRVVMWLFRWIPLLISLDWRFVSFLLLVELSFLVVRSLGSKGYFQILLNSDADKNMVCVRFYDLSWEYWHPKIISDLARGIGVPLRLDRATVEGDFRHFARVLVDIDVSTVPPSSLLLERDDSHGSFISVEYENLPTFCSTCSFIGHFPNICRWNKSNKGIPVSYSKPDSARDGPATVVAVEGFQVLHKHAPKLVFPQAEVSISNVFAAIQQDLGSLDSVVVHSSAGSDPILGMVSYASLVDSSRLTSLVAPTTSMVATQVYQSQLVGRSEDSLIGVHVHSSRMGAVPVSSEGPSSIFDVSAGAVVSISSAASMVGQGSKVSRDSVSPLVFFAQPIVSSVVSVDELDDRVGTGS